jgi:DNA/RNA-binding domain of Phe-tRNA-synthetase-like protein
MLSSISIMIDDEVKRRFEGIYLSVRSTDVIVSNSHDVSKPLESLKGELHIDIEALKDDPIIRAYRDFYWRIGVDPTKTRPASEALVRRFLKSQTLPKINNVVDAGNLASASTFVPIGLYDIEKISGKLLLRFARNGEQFTDITGKTESLKGNEIVLADDAGVLHLFPHRDSWKTMIRAETKKMLVVGCGVPRVPRSKVDDAAEKVVSLLKELQ